MKKVNVLEVMEEEIRETVRKTVEIAEEVAVKACVYVPVGMVVMGFVGEPIHDVVSNVIYRGNS